MATIDTRMPIVSITKYEAVWNCVCDTLPVGSPTSSTTTISTRSGNQCVRTGEARNVRVRVAKNEPVHSIVNPFDTLSLYSARLINVSKTIAWPSKSATVAREVVLNLWPILLDELIGNGILQLHGNRNVGSRNGSIIVHRYGRCIQAQGAQELRDTDTHLCAISAHIRRGAIHGLSQGDPCCNLDLLLINVAQRLQDRVGRHSISICRHVALIRLECIKRRIAKRGGFDAYDRHIKRVGREQNTFTGLWLDAECVQYRATHMSLELHRMPFEPVSGDNQRPGSSNERSIDTNPSAR